MWTKKFWKKTGEDVVVSMITAFLTLTQVDSFSPITADWKMIFAGVLFSAMVAVLKSILFLKVGTPDSPRIT